MFRVQVKISKHIFYYSRKFSFLHMCIAKKIDTFPRIACTLYTVKVAQNSIIPIIFLKWIIQ